jgi:hypothetical protein
MITYYKALGTFFGYPRCCCDAFEKDWCAETKAVFPSEHANPAPWYGTGYVPCLSCANKAIRDWPAFVIANIDPYRVCHMPFPKGDQLADKFLEEIGESK